MISSHLSLQPSFTPAVLRSSPILTCCLVASEGDGSIILGELRGRGGEREVRRENGREIGVMAPHRTAPLPASPAAEPQNLQTMA